MQPTTETSQCEACCAFCLYIRVYSLSSGSAGNDRVVCTCMYMYATLVARVMMCANLCRMEILH